MSTRRAPWILSLLVVPALLAGCTSATPSPSVTITHTQTVTTAPTDPTPIAAGPTSVRDGTCPLADQQTLADDIGMRLARTVVLSSAGATVGCSFYALQDSPLATSERLPGPDQPAIQVTTARYASALDAHNAMVLGSRAPNTNAQQARIATGLIGVAYQSAFYPADHGKDWTVAFTKGATMVLVQTVVTDPALTAISAATTIAAGIR